ncbi:MAG: hypothetical protein HQK59_07360 [Deltaproteobacteria bacterium]|nr:hypothetical protein [Deltaproteobacteria bacterium]
MLIKEVDDESRIPICNAPPQTLIANQPNQNPDNEADRPATSNMADWLPS